MASIIPEERPGAASESTTTPSGAPVGAAATAGGSPGTEATASGGAAARGASAPRRGESGAPGRHPRAVQGRNRTAANSQSTRGRLRSRGRARGRGRGRRSDGIERNDPSEGWKLVNTDCSNILLESVFADKAIQQRALLFCKSAVSRMKLRCEVRGIPTTRCGFVVLLMNGLLTQLIEWLNESIRHRRLEEQALTMADMYRYVAVLLLSHTTGFSFEKTISLLRQVGTAPPSLQRIRFTADNILAFAPTGRGEDGEVNWDAQRDRTRQLTEFEGLAFGETRKVFFCPLHLLATLDDDLFGTRAADNQVNMLNARKADKEGHSADALADALFRVVFAIRFRRRGEPQIESVRKLLTPLLNGRGEEALSGFIVTADRGYGKPAFIDLLAEFGLGSVFVMPDHLKRVHPFVAQSYFNPIREYLEEESRATVESIGGQGEPAEEPHGSHGPLPEDTGEDTAFQVQHDRRRAFLIDVDPAMGPAVFMATKNTAGHSRSAPSVMRAIAVRERGTDKFCKVLRFMYSVPESLQKSLNTWIAVPKTNLVLEISLFAPSQVGNDVRGSKEMVEAKIQQRCDVLTLGQRCADWFVLRQFRVTGTNAGLVLMSSAEFRDAGQLSSPPVASERTMQQWLEG